MTNKIQSLIKLQQLMTEGVASWDNLSDRQTSFQENNKEVP